MIVSNSRFLESSNGSVSRSRRVEAAGIWTETDILESGGSKGGFRREEPAAMVKEGGFRRRKRERSGERERKGKRGLTEGKIENEIELVVIVAIF